MEQKNNNQVTRPKISEIARRQVFLEDTHSKLHALADTFLQWAATLENVPLVTPPVIDRLIKGAPEEELLADVVSCIVSMLDGSAGGEQAAQ
eukprot:jgi/Tetstr1/420951/TSEL_012011.t1